MHERTPLSACLENSPLHAKRAFPKSKLARRSGKSAGDAPGPPSDTKLQADSDDFVKHWMSGADANDMQMVAGFRIWF